ncbi:hypothetical protein DRQ33_03430, partial [bacterium]
MKIKIFITLILIFSAGIGLAQDLCINWFPVYLCSGECFELDVCHDTLNPGYVYDSVYIFSTLEQLATGSSGSWYPLPDTTAPLPVICNNSFFDPSIPEWVFGWDSVYIRADTNGVMAAETTIWVFHYPPDSAYIDTSRGLTICPNDTGIFYAKWLNVRGAFFWSWQKDSTFVINNFVHSDITDTAICIQPDHQSYSAPDSFSPGGIDTLYDPCPDPICTTFTLLPTDVVEDTLFTICQGIAETLIVHTTYPYDHNWVYAGSTLINSVSQSDTFQIIPTICGTTWIYYDISGSGTCSATRLDSIAIFVPCSEYEIFVNSTVPHDSGDPYCAGETLEICLEGATFDSADICWDLPGADYCTQCINYIADTSFWAYINLVDEFGCEYNDSLYIPVSPYIDFDISASKGCLGESITFTVSPDSGVLAEFVIIQFGDGSWDFIDTVDSVGDFVTTHQYDETGIYTVYVTVYDSTGCSRRDSIWIRQSTVVANLTITPNPACIGEQIYLDASSSVVYPSGRLIYHFYDPAGDSIYFGTTPHCADTIDSAGIWSVWVIDTMAGCSAYASVSVETKWVEIFAPDTIFALAGCSRCIELSAVPHNCASSVDFGYAEYDTTTGLVGTMTPLSSEQFCTPTASDDRQYYVYAWCADCPDSPDSSLIVVRRATISAETHDTTLCYGQYVPNLLDSITINPAGVEDSVYCQVIFRNEETGDLDTVMDWTLIDMLPAVFDWYPVSSSGMLRYRFAFSGAFGCIREFSARVTMHHPVAVLNILPDDVVCEAHSVTLDASSSYSNCTGATFCYRYFEQISDILIPLDDFVDSFCCAPSCSIFALSSTPSVGTHTYAVEVCMEDAPWCCDTAFQTLQVCDIDSPIIATYNECSTDTILAGRELEFYALNADSFDNLLWNIITVDTSGTNSVSIGDSSIVSYTPSLTDTIDSLIVELCAFRCEFACTACDTQTFYLDYPPYADTVFVTIPEDSCPYIAFMGGSVFDRENDSLEFELISAPEGVAITAAGTLFWDCPTNCDVGSYDILIEVVEQNACQGVCTLVVSTEVINTFAGIIGIDSLWGYSCIDSANITPDTLFIKNSEECYDMSFKLASDDYGDCDCGFWDAGRLFWLDINFTSGLVGADLYNVPRETYYDTIYHSDCSDTDSVIIAISVPNHTPRIVSVPHEIWIPAGYDTVAVTSADFNDIDGDVVSIVNTIISNSINYSMTFTASDVSIHPSSNYINFPGSPDTLTVSVNDGSGGDVRVRIFVWVYDPSEIQPESRKPSQTTIVGAYPNPFNNSVSIEVENDNTNPAKLSIVDYSGKLVDILFEGTLPPGVFTFKWSADDFEKNSVPSGKYWLILNI